MNVKAKKGFVSASLAATVALAGLLSGCSSDSGSPISPINSVPPTTSFIYTSDAHYGIKRAAFSGMSSAQQVNGAMITEMNRLQSAKVALPSADGGVNAGQTISTVDFVAETGDAVNRSDGNVYPAKNSPAKDVWPQFTADYFTKLNLLTSAGTKAPVWMTPGNHDVSNAIGYYKAPLNADAGIDATSYVGIYNLMNPAAPIATTSFTSAATAAASYAKNRLVSSRDVNGVHYLFVGMWPDSVTRPLIDADLAKVPATTPVIIFTHDQPTSESKHFTNPNGANDINSTDKFENLLSDSFADAKTVNDVVGSPVLTVKEQRAFATWLKTHKNIVAYFHGNDNANEYYTYTGPDNDVSLNVFRVDSPMKGNFSATDSNKLSFQVVSVDSVAQKMTVREYLWKTQTWGASKTVSLAPRVDPPAPTVSFRFAVTDDSRAAGGGALSPGTSAGFGNKNLVQDNGVSKLVMATIAQDIVARNAEQKIDFMLFPGDMITGEDQDPTHLSSMMDTWLDTIKPLTTAGIATFTVRGNHEYSPTSSLGAINPADPSLATYRTHFPLTAALLSPFSVTSISGAENGLTYSFTWKNAKFVAFDQYAGRTAAFDNTKFALNGPNKGQMMNSWVLDQVNNSTAPLNFVMAHEQMWPSTSHKDSMGNDPDSRDALLQALAAKNGTYMAGHDHMYVRGTVMDGTNKVPAFVVGTGGGGNYDYASYDVVANGYTGKSRYNVQKSVSSSANPTFGYMLVTVYSNNTWSAEFRGFNFNKWNDATNVALTPFTVMDSFRNSDLY